jgi:antitoxin MazE6
MVAVQRCQWVRYNSGYTLSMKTAVSVPDDLFKQAEAAARRLRFSRSRLYTKAIAEFLERQQSQAVTERLNEVYSRRPAKVDAALRRAQLKSLGKSSW